ncbi:MAG: hypothetical protein KDD76_05920, partial [Rickettsiales bacterium]|nr:hypothetical protein [Rickettsiales bacterium]
TPDLDASKKRLEDALFVLEDLVISRLKEADSIAAQAASAGTVKELRQLHDENIRLKKHYEEEKEQHIRMRELNRQIASRLDRIMQVVTTLLEEGRA